jgi:hypothetical protein
VDDWHVGLFKIVEDAGFLDRGEVCESEQKFTCKKVLADFFLRKILALVDAQLPLRVDAAAFACVLASKNRRELEKRAFGTQCAHFSPTLSSSF